MIPKPPFIQPKPKRLAARKRMTIALGMRTSDGIVLAADREEGDGYLTNERGKIFRVFRASPPIGWIGITGAGDGPALDEISKGLGEVFSAQIERSPKEAVAALSEAHRDYYKATILPFAQPQDRPDYSLIIGCLEGQTGKGLFATSHLAFNESNDYESVGVGASIANELLGTLYDFVPSISAVRLAAYIVYRVKNLVSGCGLGTDVVVLKPKRLFPRVPTEVIRKWEEAFRYYPSLERNTFNYCIGVEPKPGLLRSKPDSDSVRKGIENMRNILMPSDAEKSEWEP